MRKKIKQNNLQIEYVSIEILKPNEYNPKQMTEKEAKDLEKSIVEFGMVDPLIVNKAKEREGIIIGGHQRYKIYQKLGYEKVPVIWLDIPDLKKEQELCLRLSKNIGSWDYDLLVNFGEGMLREIGWSNRDICKIFNLDECEPEGLDQVKDMLELKILNLYSGVGGNRRLWGGLNVTAVENNKDIADAYKRLYPKDRIVIADAHQYLLDHFKEFDFIWSSPPCPTHSRLRKAGKGKPKYPDMRLYEEILLLQGFHRGRWTVENVISWYDPLIEPQRRGRHYYWANFDIPETDYPWAPAAGPIGKWNKMDFGVQVSRFCFDGKDIPKAKGYARNTILRDLIHPKEGEYVLKCAYKELWTSFQRKKGVR